MLFAYEWVPIRSALVSLSVWNVICIRGGIDAIRLVVIGHAFQGFCRSPILGVPPDALVADFFSFGYRSLSALCLVGS
jgi:hypothetical protein